MFLTKELHQLVNFYNVSKGISFLLLFYYLLFPCQV